MEKLSGILPASPRVKSVDMSDAKPRRPGAPTFGAPTGMTASVRDKLSLSKVNPDEVAEEMPTYKPKDFAQAKIADQMTKKFFETRIRPEEMGSSSIAERIDENLGESLAEVTQQSPSMRDSIVKPDSSREEIR